MAEIRSFTVEVWNYSKNNALVMDPAHNWRAAVYMFDAELPSDAAWAAWEKMKAEKKDRSRVIRYDVRPTNGEMSSRSYAQWDNNGPYC